MTIVPGPKKIIVKFVSAPETTESGLITIPESAKSFQILTSEAVSELRFGGDETIIPEGTRVVFVRENASEIEIDGEKYFIMDESSVFALILPDE